MISIRHATDGDLPAGRELVRAVGLPLEGLGDVPTDLFVAYDGASLVGFAALEHHGSHGLVRSVAVVPDRQGEGIGSQLIDAVERHADESDIDGVYLLTETAEPFFAARGYEIIGRDEGPMVVMASVEWSEACGVGAVPMVRR